MGQIESFGISEILLYGLIIGLFINYITEEEESDTFESFKPYLYTGNLALKKIKKLGSYTILAITTTKAAFRVMLPFNFYFNSKLEITRELNNFNIWVDPALMVFDMKKYTFEVRNKYSFIINND